jgi:hypothetical protein
LLTMAKKCPLVVVYWSDASSHDPWIYENEIEEIEEPTDVVTVGFLIRKPTEKNKQYFIASTKTLPKEGYLQQHCCIMKIPEVCVKSVTELSNEI